MQTTRQYEVSLSPDTADFVESKLRSGHHSSVGEVFIDGAQALLKRERMLEALIESEC